MWPGRIRTTPITHPFPPASCAIQRTTSSQPPRRTPTSSRSSRLSITTIIHAPKRDPIICSSTTACNGRPPPAATQWSSRSGSGWERPRKSWPFPGRQSGPSAGGVAGGCEPEGPRALPQVLPRAAPGCRGPRPRPPGSCRGWPWRWKRWWAGSAFRRNAIRSRFVRSQPVALTPRIARMV